MKPKDVQKKIQKLMKRNQRVFAVIMHYLPAPIIVYFIFDLAFPIMLKKKDLRKFKNTQTSFQFVISGMPGVKKWVIELDHGKGRIYRGELDFPETIINASARDFIDTTTGYLNPEMALMSGRMTVNGPVMKMKTFQSIFA